MMKYKSGINLKTKIIIIIFFILVGLYLIDKFFDNFTLVSPIKKLEFQFIIQPRRNFNTLKSRLTPQKFDLQGAGKEKRYLISENTETPQKTAKFGQILASSKTIETEEWTDERRAREAIYIYFGNDKVAYAIARAESGFNCKAVSHTGDYGLFQINKVHLWRFEKEGLDWSNCWDNAKVARQIYEEQGWYPWSVFQNKKYLQFIN